MNAKLIIPTFCLIVAAVSPAKAACSYSLSPATATLGADAYSGVFTVTTTTKCSWDATTTNGWIHLVATNSAGNGNVVFSVDANPSTGFRVGYIRVSSSSGFTITQGPALGVGVEATNLAWTTSSDYPWFVSSAPTYDGVDSVASGNKFAPNSVSWMQTTVVGPGTLSFWWKVDSDVTPPPPADPYSYDAVQFLINDELQDQIMGQIDWNYRVYTIPEGTNILTWQYVKDGLYNLGEDRGWLDQVIFATNVPIGLSTALDTCGINWTTGGNNNPTYWAGQTNMTHDGKSAAQSGAITSNQESWMEATVVGATNVSFWWKVSSETNFDFLEFYTNGVLARRISGEVTWSSNYFTLNGGATTLRWRYFKNSLDFYSKGQDHGWLDQVVINPPQKPVLQAYATNVTLSTSASDCQAVLPDLTAPSYFILGDNCGSITVTQTPPASTVLPVGTSTAVVTAFDQAGNYTRVTNNIAVVDQIPPTLKLLGLDPLTVECQGAFVDPGASASDNCSGSVSLLTNGTVNVAQVGNYTIVYVALDASGNAATNSRTVNVVDTQPPVIALLGSNPLSVECHSLFTDPGATAFDTAAGAVTVIAGGSVDANTPGTYTITYTATDGYNTATNSRTVIVRDTLAPLITFSFGTLNLTAASGESQVVLPDLTGSTYVMANDNCSSVTITQIPPAGATVPAGTNTIVLSAADASGNTSFSTNYVVVASTIIVPVMITSQTMLANGLFELTFTGPPAQSYRVLATEDPTAAAASWTVLTNAFFGSEPAIFTDTSASLYPKRFYRVVSP